MNDIVQVIKRQADGSYTAAPGTIGDLINPTVALADTQSNVLRVALYVLAAVLIAKD